MTRAAVVHSVLDLRLVVPGGPTLPVRADLRYATDDPWAVHVTFHTGAGADGTVRWLFARQLLTEGVADAVGEGDVRLWPSRSDDAPVVNLAMSSPSGAALFEIDRDAVVEFLQQTYLAVPTGHEAEVVDLDAELATLLSR